MKIERISPTFAVLTSNSGFQNIRGSQAEVDQFIREFEQLAADAAIKPAVVAANALTGLNATGQPTHNETALPLPRTFDEPDEAHEPGFDPLRGLANRSGRETPLYVPASFLPHGEDDLAPVVTAAQLSQNKPANAGQETPLPPSPPSYVAERV
jgi:hypothetical protein